jgi:hypothetical protein
MGLRTVLCTIKLLIFATNHEISIFVLFMFVSPLRETARYNAGRAASGTRGFRIPPSLVSSVAPIRMSACGLHVITVHGGLSRAIAGEGRLG